MKFLNGKRYLNIKLSQAINQWLYEKDDGVHRYMNFLDRTTEIGAVIEETLENLPQPGSTRSIYGADQAFTDFKKFLDTPISKLD